MTYPLAKLPTIDASRYECISGKEFYGPNGLKFNVYEDVGQPPDCPNDGGYRTIYGPSVSFKRIIHANTNKSLNDAFNGRILLLRPGDDLLRAQQVSFIAAHRESGLLTKLHLRWCALVPTVDFMTDIADHISDPHNKKRLREEAWASTLDQGIAEGELWLTNSRVKIKIKRDEFAKMHKVGRTIADMGVSASLVGFMLTHRLKTHMIKALVDHGHESHFLMSPSEEGLQEAFDSMLNPKYTSYFLYFSDDSTYTVRTPEGVRWWNIDISKCDCSHTPRLFQLLLEMTPPCSQRIMEVLIGQCAADLVIDAPERRYGRHKVRLRSKNGEPHLLSGSTLTTIINNLACLLIRLSFQEITGVVTTAKLVNAARTCGYIITAEECHVFEKVQFLKHSPTLDVSGTYRPLLNLGVLLRATGTCRGDLPGRGPLPARAAAFQRLLLNGMYNTSHFPLIDSMKAKVASAKFSAKDERIALMRIGETKLVHKTHFTFDEASIARRYDLSLADIRELTEGLGNAGFGEVHDSHASRVILFTDYGLED